MTYTSPNTAPRNEPPSQLSVHDFSDREQLGDLNLLARSIVGTALLFSVVGMSKAYPVRDQPGKRVSDTIDRFLKELSFPLCDTAFRAYVDVKRTDARGFIKPMSLTPEPELAIRLVLDPLHSTTLPQFWINAADYPKLKADLHKLATGLGLVVQGDPDIYQNPVPDYQQEPNDRNDNSTTFNSKFFGPSTFRLVQFSLHLPYGIHARLSRKNAEEIGNYMKRVIDLHRAEIKAFSKMVTALASQAASDIALAEGKFKRS